MSGGDKAKPPTMSLSELARVLRRHRNTVAGWIAEGCPVAGGSGRGNGEAWQFELPAVVRWLEERAGARARVKLEREVERLRAALAGAHDSGEHISTEEARRRKTVAQARLAEYELARVEGMTLVIADIAPVVGQVFAEVRGKLITLGVRVAPLVAVQAEPAACRELIDAEVFEALSVLSAGDVVSDAEERAHGGGER